jgi:hypothetical protein
MSKKLLNLQVSWRLLKNATEIKSSVLKAIKSVYLTSSGRRRFYSQETEEYTERCASKVIDVASDLLALESYRKSVNIYANLYGISLAIYPKNRTNICLLITAYNDKEVVIEIYHNKNSFRMKYVEMGKARWLANQFYKIIYVAGYGTKRKYV